MSILQADAPGLTTRGKLNDPEGTGWLGRADMWRNWSGQQRCQPLQTLHPADPDEVADVVRRAATRGLHVRVAGAGHSFTDAVCTPDILLALDRMQEVLDVAPDAGRVRVQAGCTLGRLSRKLACHGLALRNLGDIDRQTVGGALATATHGTGLRLPTLVEELTEIELIDADGNLRTFSRGSDDEAFRAAQVSLGTLGVVTAVTLRCEPSFRLRMTEQPRPVEEILHALPDLTDSHEHFEAFLFPYADTALARYADRASDPPTPDRPARRWLREVLVGNYLFEALLFAGRAAPPLAPPLSRLTAAAAGSSQRVQDSHSALANPRLMRFVEMEWILPAAAAASAVRAVIGLVRGRRLKVNMPIELRFVAADRAFLSPSHGRQSCCLAVHAYRGMAWQPYFRAVEKLMWELDGRPHWGKLHFQTFQTLRSRYPEWDRFATVRARLDPDGRFRNSYTDRVLGLPGI